MHAVAKRPSHRARSYVFEAAVGVAVGIGLVGAALSGAPRLLPALYESNVSAQATVGLNVTGVATNNSSARVYFQPVAAARDYRIYDITAPTSVKYAGLTH